jgi:hypothetical protein
VADLYVEVLTFDGGTPIDLPITKVDRKGRELVRKALLGGSAGSSSKLGPAWIRSEASGLIFKGATLTVVASDFELFDANPGVVIGAMRMSRSNEVLALTLNHESPDLFANSRVRCASVMPGDDPAHLAQHILDAASACVPGNRPRRRS